MDEWLGLGKPTARRARPWIIVTLVIGCLFVAGQIVAWQQLATQHVFISSGPSAHSMFLFTALHGLHLLVGLGALGAALLGLSLSKQMENRQILVDLSAWYWHSMGVLWVGLFLLLAYLQ